MSTPGDFTCLASLVFYVTLSYLLVMLLESPGKWGNSLITSFMSLFMLIQYMAHMCQQPCFLYFHVAQAAVVSVLCLVVLQDIIILLP